MNTISFFMTLLALVASLPVIIHAAPTLATWIPPTSHAISFPLSSQAAPTGKPVSPTDLCVQQGNTQGLAAADALTCDNVLHRRSDGVLDNRTIIKRGSPDCPSGDLQNTYNNAYNNAFNTEFDVRYKDCSS